MNNLTAQTSVEIEADASQVWDALTNPEKIKIFLMGTTVKTDWKVGSPISYTGEYNGKAYSDKGVIKKIERNKVFESTYLSSVSGKEDKPENYNTVTYVLSPKDGATVLTLTQDNIQSEKEKEHTTSNWNMVLGKLKEVVEQKE